MRLLIRLVCVAGLVLARAHAASDPPAGATDAAIEAHLAAGEVGRALELAQRIESAAGLEAAALTFYETGTGAGTDAARQLFERALALRERRADEDPEPLASLLDNLSGLYFDHGDYAKAEDAERRALEIFERIYPPDDPRTALARRDLGLVLAYEGRLRDAESSLVAALGVIEAAPGAAAPDADWAEIANGRNYLAELYRLEGRYAESAALLEELVRVAPERLGADSPQVPYYLNNLAGVYRDQGRFDEAETLLRRSRALREAASPRNDGAVATAILNLAELDRLQGKLEEAEPLYREALELARSAYGAESPELFEFLNQSAVLDRDRGLWAQAEPRFRQALALAEAKLGSDHPRVAQCRLDLAELLRARGACAVAEEQYRTATEIRERVFGPDHPDVAEVLTAHARCLTQDRERRNLARERLDRAVEILGASEAHPEVAADALAQRAELRRPTDPAGARNDLAAALRAVEAMRPHRGGGESVRAEFFSRHAELYGRMVRWEIEGRRVDLALAVAERGRARVLLDQLRAAHVGERASPDPEIERRESAARSELAEIRERMTFESSRKDVPESEKRRSLTALERRLERASRTFRSLYDEARNASPAWRDAVALEPATVEQIQSDVVPEDGLMLLYEIGVQESWVFLVPRAPGAIEVRPLVVGRESAGALGVAAGPLTARALDTVLAGPSGVLADLRAPRGGASRGVGGLAPTADLDLARLLALERVLVPGDLGSSVSRAREVLVVPDGSLFLLPFEALVLERGADVRATRFWLDDGPVVRYAPSATLVHELRGRPAARRSGRASALSVANPVFSAGPRTLPRLPGTATESVAVRGALGPIADVTVLDGPEAREATVRQALAGKRYVHVATHGLVDEAGGEIFAALALTPPPGGAPPVGDDDGFLQLFEIYDLQLDCALAVLSACSSNTGRVVAGEGVFALSRAFLVAGAQSVVASQWAVDDASTAELVGELFRRVAAQERAGRPVDAARALRDAKRHVRRARAEWAHPFYWGPFAITGVD